METLYFQVQKIFELLSLIFNIEDLRRNLRGRSIITFEGKKNDFVTTKVELKIASRILCA